MRELVLYHHSVFNAQDNYICQIPLGFLGDDVLREILTKPDPSNELSLACRHIQSQSFCNSCTRAGPRCNEFCDLGRRYRQSQFSILNSTAHYAGNAFALVQGYGLPDLVVETHCEANPPVAPYLVARS